MARPAPAVDRAVEILDFLADNPRDAFSLSELARRLDLNKASAHAILNALTDRGLPAAPPRPGRTTGWVPG